MPASDLDSVKVPEGLAGNAGLYSLMNEVLLEEADVSLQKSTSFKYKIFWALGLSVLAIYLLYTMVGAYRDAEFSQRVAGLFKSEPGYVVTSSSMESHVLNVSGLQDPIARPLTDLLAAHKNFA